MGYYKQEEIKQQVEVAHRPKPATVHVAWPTPQLERLLKQQEKAARFAKRVATVNIVIAGMALVFLGLMLGRVL